MQDKSLTEIFFEIKSKFKIILSKYGNLVWILLTLILFLLSISIYQNTFSRQDLTVRFLDVGQGDAILIQTPNKENILLDAGPDDKVVRKLEKYVSLFNRDINLAILSHGDSDHVTGFIYALRKYNVENILENGDILKDTEVFKETQNKIDKEAEKIKVERYTANCGDKISFGAKSENNILPVIYILNPIQNYLSEKDTNTNSVVALLTYGNYSFLFTGDEDKEIEQKLFFNLGKCFNVEDKNKIENALKNLTVYKASHHGSDSGNSEEFIKKLKPEYSVISAGKNNRYGHPDKSVVEILEKYSENILNTITDGDIAFKTDGVNLEVIKEK